MEINKSKGKKMFLRSAFAFIMAASLLLAGCSSKDTNTSASKEVKPDVNVSIGSLKGPTSIGLSSMMTSYDGKEDYKFSISNTADELVGQFSQKKVDIALVPANLASVLYNKTKGQVKVIDINTLGVLYIVSGDKEIKTLDSLKGKTLYMTGKGTTPDYVLQALLEKSGISKDDLTIEYKSEPTEVAAALNKIPGAVALLPQPFAKAVTLQNKNLSINIDLNKVWEESYPDSKQVTGVTIARSEFIKEHPDAVHAFMSEHKKSVESVNKNVNEAAKAVVKYKILDKEPLAKAAIPLCNVTYIDGDSMKSDLSSYLQVLSKLDPKAVGGKLPDDNFYYTAE